MAKKEYTITHGAAQEVKAPKPTASGGKPGAKVTRGEDLRTGKSGK